MKKNICCSVNEDTFNKIPKARFVLAESKKTLSEVLAEMINKYADEYDTKYQKVQE